MYSQYLLWDCCSQNKNTISFYETKIFHLDGFWLFPWNYKFLWDVHVNHETTRTSGFYVIAKLFISSFPNCDILFDSRKELWSWTNFRWNFPTFNVGIEFKTILMEVQYWLFIFFKRMCLVFVEKQEFDPPSSTVSLYPPIEQQFYTLTNFASHIHMEHGNVTVSRHSISLLVVVYLYNSTWLCFLLYIYTISISVLEGLAACIVCTI